VPPIPSMRTRTSAATPTSAATTASPLSKGLRAGAIGALRGAGAGRGAWVTCRGAVAGPGEPAAWAEAGAAGAWATGAAGAGVADATAAGEGILIVGDAVGLGGRLIRTVSFFGCTLPDSEGLEGVAPGGGFGVFSAIIIDRGKLKFALPCVNCFNAASPRKGWRLKRDHGIHHHDGPFRERDDLPGGGLC
jgi:hypothetical protein